MRHIRRPRRTTIPYYLFEHIRDLIITGVYRPGQALREQELEARFDTSRGPIREALRMLELRGLVTHAPRRGFRVIEYTERDIKDIYRIRANLEAYSITELERSSTLHLLLAQLEEKNARMRQAYDEGNVWQYIEENKGFHIAIMEDSGNKALRLALAQLTEIAQPLRYNALSRYLGESKSLMFHEAIVARLAQRDFLAARDLMAEHIMISLPTILKAYFESQDNYNKELKSGSIHS